jgi:hypothetical protein
MGFWHTGYIEFHEPAGLEGEFEFRPAQPKFPCSQCGQTFASPDDLRRHRFEAHALRRPALYIGPHECGSHRIRIARPVRSVDVRVEDCDRITLNGGEIKSGQLGRMLSRVQSDVCRIVLEKQGITTTFELEIRIASESDLGGVESQFMRMARGKRLDMRAIEEFIEGTAEFSTAIGYCDGICAFLYGLLAKERAHDISLRYEDYAAKYSTAAEQLLAYDRKLARVIGSVIEFHFNHFQESSVLSPGTRVAAVASRYMAWLEAGKGEAIVTNASSELNVSATEALVTDWETERIVRWAVRSLSDLRGETQDMEGMLLGDLAQFDKVKLHVLLGEIYGAGKLYDRALKHAKSLRNLPLFEQWAERSIKRIEEHQ